MATRKAILTPGERTHWRQMIAMGYTRADIARKYGRSRQYVSSVVGGVEGKQKRKEKTVYVEDSAWRRAQKIAAKLGFRIRTGDNAGQGSVAMMIENIGNGHLAVITGRVGGSVEVKETLTLEFVFVMGQYVRIKDDATVSETFEFARGIPLVIDGYMAQGDDRGDDFFYRCRPVNQNDPRVAFLTEDVLKPIKLKEKKGAPAKAA